MRGAACIIKALWKWSWVATLPIAVFFFVWIKDTAESYRLLKLDYRATMNVGLKSIGSMRAGLLLNDLGSVSHALGDNRGLPAVNIYVQEGELKKLDADLPYSGRQYVEAKLLYPDGKLFEVKMKYRGDFSYHWAERKKSIRIKTKKERLYDGMREFNLIIPKTPHIITDHLAYSLAKKMGLMAPESNPVEVYINGRYMGVEILTEQIGEQFLRRNDRMPGDIYVGELVGTDVFPIVGTEVFLNPGFWSKAAINNHNEQEWNESLVRLSSAVYRGDMDALSGLLDMDEWARFAAFITLTRTVHFDAEHNWRLFFDPSMGRFIPIVWDPLGWNYKDYVPLIEAQTNRMDIITNLIFEALHRDQRFLLKKHTAMEEFFKDGGAEHIAGLLYDTAPLFSSLKRDRNLHFESSYVLSPSEVISNIDELKGLVKKSLIDVREAYIGTPPVASYSVDEKTGEIWVIVEGFAPVRALEADYSSIKGPLSARLSYTSDGKAVSRDLSGAISLIDKDTVRIDAPLFARRAMSAPALRVPIIIRDAVISPATYSFGIKGAKARDLLSLKAILPDGKTVEVRRAESSPAYPLDGTFNVAPLEEKPTETVFSSDITINGVREVEDLVIRPGVTVRLAPSASLVIRGRLQAKGEPGRIVRFLPLDAAKGPWGAVILTGSGANGSLLSHCEFKGGSGARHALVEHSAMLSVHGVKGVEIENCAFSDNKLVDDMVHLVYSEVTIKESVFTGAKADALDLDYVRGQVIDSQFIKSGNDGLDLMSSHVAVLGSSMEGSGDKGISVGEGTEVFVLNTRLTGNQIGVQAKDGSTAVIYNSVLSGNAKTIDAYKKNWQYGDGGHALVYKSRLEAQGVDALTADKNSSIAVFDSYMSGGVAGKVKRIRIHESVDSEKGFEAKARTPDLFGMGQSPPEFVRPFMEKMKPAIRGTYDGA
ncbi:MAG: CotH kinase family protein [Deltaproteobacteria bacterium]|nr:CotH kinase family protein [Deltaproteobacteria bacterium]